MKNILVATDFSEAAYHATSYAYEMAETFGAQLIIYTAYHEMPVILPEMPLIATPEDMRTYTKELLMQNVVQLNSKGKIPIKTDCSEEDAASGIIMAAKKYNADIIVVGMKGTGRNMRKMFGSTVTSLINKTSIPMLVVPGHVKFTPIKTLVLANESDLPPQTDIQLINIIEEVAKKFNSKIYLVRIVKNEIKEAFGMLDSPLRIKGKFKSFSPEYICLHGESVVSGLNKFIHEHNVDLLITLSHQHVQMMRWLAASTTVNLIYHIAVPLLVLPVDKKSSPAEHKLHSEIIL